MRRIAVIGTSGSGKTRLARQLAVRLAIPHLELDSVYHGENWRPATPDEFRAVVAEFVAGDAWVTDGNYSVARDLVWGRADTVIWLDYPRSRVMARLIRRTLGRGLLRHELWNGNRESLTNLARRTPADNIVLWGWTTHGPNRSKFETAMAEPQWSHLRFIRLRSPAQARRLVAMVGPGAVRW